MTKIKKSETIEEFMARGGEVIVIPPQESEEAPSVIKPSVHGLPELMSLSDGEHFFGESRKKIKKKITNQEFQDKVRDLNLPASVIASLIGSVGDKK